MNKALVIGTSFGGLEALKTIISALPADFKLPILVVLHIGDNNNDSFVQYLNGISKLSVKEAEEKDEIKKGHVYFAPPNYHMMVEDDETISFSADSKVHHSRPSIDVLFESAAWTYKNQLIGVILTGLNQDGAYGLKTIKDYGGTTLVENPENAVASIMPKAAISESDVDFVLELNEISNKLVELSEQQ
jgi:Chemotaxis response regulator containing a CheY-like receiver domain and a methylesterase domain